MNRKWADNNSENKKKQWNNKMGTIILLFVIVVSSIIGIISITETQGQKRINDQGRPMNSQVMNVTKKWYYKSRWDSSPSSPIAVDLDNDDTLEVLVGSDKDKLHCISHTNTIEWYYQTGDNIKSSPCVANLDGDRTLEVLVGDDEGKFYCLSHTGSMEWSYQTGNNVYSSPCVADLDDDGTLEVLVPSYDNKIYCLSHTGSEEWHYKAADLFYFSSPAVADLDDDGTLEVLVGCCDYKLYCLSHTGSVEWSYETGFWVSSSPAVADLDNDGSLEIIMGSYDDYIYCLSHTGSVEWSYKTNGDIFSSPAVADLDNDGTLEVLAGSFDNRLYCLSHTGMEEWHYRTNHDIESSPTLADLDGDGTLEVIIGSNDNKLYCLSHTGTEEWSYVTEGDIRSSPCVADLDGDGVLEVLVSSNDDYLYCLSLTGVTSSGAAPWYCFRGSIFHTGWMDSDSDYLDDLTERYYSTDPLNPDSDGDGKRDGEEVQAGRNPLKWDNWSKVFKIYLIPVYCLLFIGITTGLFFVTRKRLRQRRKRRKARMEALMMEGQQLLEQEELEGAMERFTQVLTIQSDYAPALEGQQKVLMEKQRQKVQPIIQKAYQQLKNNDWELAERTFQEALDIYPESEAAVKGLEEIQTKRKEREEEREAILRNILMKVESMSVEDMTHLLRFDDEFAFKTWLLELPPDLPLKLSGNQVLVAAETLSQDLSETEQAITRLLESFEQMEKEGKKKKS